jgi:hypothetical protein
MATTTIVDQIHEGEFDELLDQITLASLDRRRHLRSLQMTPATERFINVVQSHPGLVATELAALLDCTVQRVYQLAAAAEDHLKPIDYAEYPRKFHPREQS